MTNQNANHSHPLGRRRRSRNHGEHLRRERIIRLSTFVVGVLMIVFITIPLFNRYVQLSQDATQLDTLQADFKQARKRHDQLARVESKLNAQLTETSGRSIEPEKIDAVRQTLVKIIRDSGARLRHLEISDSHVRDWATEGDQAASSAMPLYAEPSRFHLHRHTIELQAAGSIKSVQSIIEQVYGQHWLANTKLLRISPSANRNSPVNLMLNLIVYGIKEAPPEKEFEEDFASLSAPNLL